jgi:hypothetical protein
MVGGFCFEVVVGVAWWLDVPVVLDGVVVVVVMVVML